MLLVFSIKTLILPGYITFDRHFSQIIAAFGEFANLARHKFKLLQRISISIITALFCVSECLAHCDCKNATKPLCKDGDGICVGKFNLNTDIFFF